MIRVVVGIITRRRLEGLERLLEGLAAQTLDRIEADVRVLVVDNDPEATSRALVERRAEAYPYSLEWAHETSVGIPFARNEVVRRAEDADYIAFIDDDEWPEPDWLAQLLQVQQRFDADVVAGPVLSEFEREPPAWIVRGGFFERPRRATGSRITAAGTGNILLRTSILRRVDGPFNEAMAKTGGSDAYLVRALDKLGARMVWANDAVATETVPESRVTASWLLRRAFRTGLMRGYTEHEHGDALRTLRVVAQGQLKVATGLVAAPLRLGRGREHAVKALRRTLYGAGMVAGVFGHRYEEYREVHGR